MLLSVVVPISIRSSWCRCNGKFFRHFPRPIHRRKDIKTSFNWVVPTSVCSLQLGAVPAPNFSRSAHGPTIGSRKHIQTVDTVAPVSVKGLHFTPLCARFRRRLPPPTHPWRKARTRRSNFARSRSMVRAPIRSWKNSQANIGIGAGAAYRRIRNRTLTEIRVRSIGERGSTRNAPCAVGRARKLNFPAVPLSAPDSEEYFVLSDQTLCPLPPDHSVCVQFVESQLVR